MPVKKPRVPFEMSLAAGWGVKSSNICICGGVHTRLRYQGQCRQGACAVARGIDPAGKVG